LKNMGMKVSQAGFLGTGHCVPDQVWTNKDLEKMMDTSDEWIRTRTGIAQRYVAPKGVNTSDLATGAARKALEMACVSAKDLDLIIVCTLTPDRSLPATACKVQANLGAVNVPAFDLNAACSGFVYASIIAKQFIETGLYKNILVVGAEILTRVINWHDRGSCVLFGDGAGAAVIGRVDDGYGMFGTDMGAQGEGGQYLTIPSSGVEMPRTDETIKNELAFAQMDGKEVYKFAVHAMPGAAAKVMKLSGWTSDEVAMLIPHQANLRIIESASKRLHIPMNKIFVNIQNYANTSGASIPIAMDEANRAGLLHRGDKVVLAGFGAGLTWAGLAMKWF